MVCSLLLLKSTNYQDGACSYKVRFKYQDAQCSSAFICT